MEGSPGEYEGTDGFTAGERGEKMEDGEVEGGGRVLKPL